MRQGKLKANQNFLTNKKRKAARGQTSGWVQLIFFVLLNQHVQRNNSICVVFDALFLYVL